ncbi:hypothetical protein [Ferruginibacter profundus]
MRYFFLILIGFYSCKGNEQKILLNKDKIKINGVPFVQAAGASVNADSSYTKSPGTCCYLSCDSCKYMLIKGTWRIKDSDSLYFSSIDIVSNSVL